MGCFSARASYPNAILKWGKYEACLKSDKQHRRFPKKGTEGGDINGVTQPHASGGRVLTDGGWEGFLMVQHCIHSKDQEGTFSCKHPGLTIVRDNIIRCYGWIHGTLCYGNFCYHEFPGMWGAVLILELWQQQPQQWLLRVACPSS